jgi:hypothetical protein
MLVLECEKEESNTYASTPKLRMSLKVKRYAEYRDSSLRLCILKVCFLYRIARASWYNVGSPRRAAINGGVLPRHVMTSPKICSLISGGNRL